MSAKSKQHEAPCKDCPWRRIAAAGWLGRLTIDQWLDSAHGESFVECHTASQHQCAGVAIYRANVAKMPRDQKLLRLPADREKVFASRMEFTKHHAKHAGCSSRLLLET